VPFDDARAPDVESVLAWCRDPGRRAVRLIHGPGGHGKTRLLIEVMRLLGPGWHAGFLERIEPSPPGGTYERLCAGGRPVCIAVDYAETRREEVVRLLRRVHGGTAPRLRVVLLARSPGEWWGQLAEEDADVQALLRRYKSEYRLEVLPDDLVTRQAAFTSAARAFAARLSLGIVPPVPPGLTRPEFGRFLLVHMAALAAVDGQRPSTVGELLAGTLEREARHWRLGLKDLGLDANRYRALVAQAVTLATLAGGLRSTGELKQAIAAAPRAGGLPDVDLYAIADILACLYPDPNGLGALRPDLLGEELAAKELRQDAALLDKAFSPAVPAERLANGLTVLSRLARREPEQIDLLRAALAGRLDRLAAPGVKVTVETGGPLGRVLAATLRGEPPANPRSLQRLLPQHTVALREFRVVVAEQIRAVLLSSPERASMPNRAELARITAMLGVYLGELNRPEAALAAAEEATATYRALAAVQPAALPSLAASLSSLSTRLRSLNRHEAALAAAKEAITTFRAAALAHPEVPRHGLAASLSNLSVLLGDLNRPGEALAAAKEAAAIYRDLAETHPEISRPGLAASLSNLAGWLRGLKRLDDALPVLQEAIGTYRILAAANHDAFRPELAQSLSNLGLLLSQTNRRGEALLAEEEAVAIRRALAAADPDAFRPNLARSLSNLGDRLEENGRLADALAAGPRGNHGQRAIH
jgi:tetratricopeptide (TPR) repeat protein